MNLFLIGILHAQHIAQLLQLVGHVGVDHHEVGLPAGLDGAVDNILGGGVGLDHDGGAVELTGLVQGSTFSQGSQPKSITGPILRLGCTPT